ncbi:MAG: S1C family serine protease [Clostridiales bacterium]|nr:S1C family serine protease [Clostridiales bacterium]
MNRWKKYGAAAMAAVVLAGAGVGTGILRSQNEVSAEETEETQRVTLNVVSEEEETQENSADLEESGEAETESADVADDAAQEEADSENSGESERVTLNVGGASGTEAEPDDEDGDTDENIDAEEEESENQEENETADEIEPGTGSTVSSVETVTDGIVTTDVSAIVENCMSSIVSISYDVDEEADTDSDTDEDSGFYSDGYYYYYIDDTDTEGTTDVEETTASGIIIAQNDEELLIVTNYHVVSDATNLKVGFSVDAENEEDLVVSARVKGTNSTYDLAVIAVQLSDIEDSVLEQLKIATLGSSEELKVGEAAIAISNALGYGQSVTVGVISALNRSVTINDTTLEVILTDAAIDIGSSGGALLNASGEVVGICVANESGDSAGEMGYVIPMDTAIPVLENLINKETRDKLSDSERGYIGATVVTVSDDVAGTYNMPQGAFVYEVSEGSAAEEAGLQNGDIITAIEGESVSSSTELIEKMSYYAPGETITLEVQTANNGSYETREVEVTLQEGSSSDDTEEEQDAETQTEEIEDNQDSAPDGETPFGEEEGEAGEKKERSEGFEDDFEDGFEDYNNQFN